MPDRASRRDPILIKRYANRRLYNTESATYMSLDDLSAMLRHGRRFVVREAETGEDVTDAVLERLP
jgi:polyhydroxyalkanoate synthesis repressor PhaR